MESNTSAIMVEAALTLPADKMREAIVKHEKKVATLAVREYFEDKASRLQPKLVENAIRTPMDSLNLKMGWLNSGGASYVEHGLNSWSIFDSGNVKPLLGAIVVMCSDDVDNARRLNYAKAINANLEARSLGKVLMSNDDNPRIVVTKKPEAIQAYPIAFGFPSETTFTLVASAS